MKKIILLLSLFVFLVSGCSEFNLPGDKGLKKEEVTVRLTLRRHSDDITKSTLAYYHFIVAESYSLENNIEKAIA